VLRRTLSKEVLHTGDGLVAAMEVARHHATHPTPSSSTGQAQASEVQSFSPPAFSASEAQVQDERVPCHAVASAKQGRRARLHTAGPLTRKRDTRPKDVFKSDARDAVWSTTVHTESHLPARTPLSQSRGPTRSPRSTRSSPYSPQPITQVSPQTRPRAGFKIQPALMLLRTSHSMGVLSSGIARRPSTSTSAHTDGLRALQSGFDLQSLGHTRRPAGLKASGHYASPPRLWGDPSCPDLRDMKPRTPTCALTASSSGARSGTFNARSRFHQSYQANTA
jgi:hypothetical protein